MTAPMHTYTGRCDSGLSSPSHGANAHLHHLSRTLSGREGPSSEPRKVHMGSKPPVTAMEGTPIPPEPGAVALRFAFDREDALKALASETVERSVVKLSGWLKLGFAVAAFGIGALGLQGILQQHTYGEIIRQQEQRAADLKERADTLEAKAAYL